jgi:enolase
MLSLDGTKTKSKLGANALLGDPWPLPKQRQIILTYRFYRYIGCKHLRTSCSDDEHYQWCSHSDAPIAFSGVYDQACRCSFLPEGLRMGAEIFIRSRSIARSWS